MKKLLLLCLCLALLTGCTGPESMDTPKDTLPDTDNPSGTEPQNSELFSDRDLQGGYDGTYAVITLTGSSAQCDSSAVQVSGSTVTITDEGTYVISGSLDDGSIIVDAAKEDKTQLVLNGVSIHSETAAPIYIRQADKVFLTLAENTENTLSNGGSFTADGDVNIDAVVFSREDLTLNGNGSLTVTSPAGHGVVSKDDLIITGGNYTVSCALQGFSGKDSVRIADGSFTVTAGKDGIHAENDEDSSLGFLHIANGTFQITAEGDGISAGAYSQILGGSFTILAGGGSLNAAQQVSDNWGTFPGGMTGPGGMNGHGGPGGKGDRPGMGGGFPGDGNSDMQGSGEDSASMKAIKAGGDLIISGGIFDLDAADDAIHSNANLTITGGSFTIATGDDGFHADEALVISDGVIDITKSYEGLEGLTIDLNGGAVSLVSSDDGLNAAGGTDQSGFGGMRGGDMFGASDACYIRITGGTLAMQASGDGIDSNGTLEISGGTVTVCGPTNGDTAVLDYGISGTITGGTFIGTGAYQMAQTFSDSTQGVFAVSVGNQAAGTGITLADSEGNILISCTPELNFALVILSCPDMVKGETYTITVGTQSGSFAAS